MTRPFFMPASIAPPLVELQNLTFGYGERRILDGVNLTIPRGKVTALMGASGGGKTTVLRLIGGQVQAQSGQVLLQGREAGQAAQDVGQLEREALRLSALLESARARSQFSGVPVRWQPTEDGFRFEGLSGQTGPEAELPKTWLDADVRAEVGADRTAGATSQPAALLLGPEPIIAPQSVTLVSRSQPDKRLRLGTDGVRPFAVQVQP